MSIRELLDQIFPWRVGVRNLKHLILGDAPLEGDVKTDPNRWLSDQNDPVEGLRKKGFKFDKFDPSSDKRNQI